MPIPDFETMMRPFLEFLSDGKTRTPPEVYEHLANVFQLTEEEQQKLQPSGADKLFPNRVRWCRLRLEKAGLLMRPQRGVYAITDQGKQLLAEHSGKIDDKFLKQYSEDYHQFTAAKKKREQNREETNSVTDQSQPNASPPDELIRSAYRDLREHLADQLLQAIKAASPYFFEKLVVDLLVAMGYGGSQENVARATKRTGDDGLDGVIPEDRLGLDVIYVQAKRWTTNNVGRPEVQAFVGALHGKKANKGVFMTTSDFSPGARQYAESVNNTKVILVDGEMLAELMIDYDLGVSTRQHITLKEIDTDYFAEE